MKKFTCSKCKTDFESDNNKCPLCGNKSKIKLSLGFKILQVGLFLFIVLIIINTKNTNTESSAEKEIREKRQEKESLLLLVEAEVGFACEKSIKSKLKNPDDAVFNYFPKLFQDEKTGNWLQKGSVTATNSFNAKIMDDYICKVRLSENKAESVSSKLIKR